jgi:signal transduction histidine kinase
MVAIAAGLFALLVLLATLQYRWLGRISDAERERMIATLNARATAFAADVDRELTRAYLLFQLDEPQPDGTIRGRLDARYERWQATARFPRLLKEIDVAESGDEQLRLQRFDPASRTVEPIGWPASLVDIRRQMRPQDAGRNAAGATMLVRTIPPPIVESVPALVVPTPIVLMNAHRAAPDLRVLPSLAFTILVLDIDYIRSEMLPSLARQHFRGTGDGIDYQLAVVKAAGGDVYHSSASFVPAANTSADAAVGLFQVRTQDFGTLAAEVRRFSALVTTTPPNGTAVRTNRPFSIVVEQRERGARGGPPLGARGETSTTTRVSMSSGPHWRLLVKHPSGSLERAIGAARRRNLLVSSSILAVLGVSVALLVASTRRAQALARRQMEFVAAVSHELRTPLAVIRTAGDNLADGVVHDRAQVRKYGELVRGEGRRLTEMLEQILEFAGIQSGQRGFAVRPIQVGTLVDDVLSASRALTDGAGLTIEVSIAHDLPPVLGDEAALRRVLQNLLGNAAKYGAGGAWIGITARARERDVEIAISDKGIGIDPAEQARIFEAFYRAPDAVAAQIQGAGLGLSLVQRIVEAHGGHVTVRSARGAGSTFTVHLPAVGRAAAGRAASDTRATRSPAADPS